MRTSGKFNSYFQPTFIIYTFTHICTNRERRRGYKKRLIKKFPMCPESVLSRCRLVGSCGALVCVYKSIYNAQYAATHTHTHSPLHSLC